MQIKGEQLFCLLKFGQLEHMQRLFYTGELYFNPIKNYRDSQEPEKSDQNEGIIYLENMKLKSVGIEHPTIGTREFKVVEGTTSRLVYFNDEPYLNFSLSSISSRTFSVNDQYSVNEKICQFGNSCVMIKDPLQFLKAVASKLKSENLEYEMGFVNYHDYNSKEKFDLTFFDKGFDFQHQEEFRIIVKGCESKPITINIGSIERYSHLVDADSMIKTEWKATRRSI